MKALLLVYVISGGYASFGEAKVERIPVSDIETCKVAGELISKDLEFKVREVSYRCVDAEERGGILYIVEAPK